MQRNMITIQNQQEIKEAIHRKIENLKKEMAGLEKAYIMKTFDGSSISRYEIEETMKLKLTKLLLLQNSLESISKDWYGNCNRCGDPIPMHKLLSHPDSNLCPNCSK